MATVDFAKLLSKKVDDAKPPAVLPDGTYRGLIDSFVPRESREKGTPYIEFKVKLLSAEDDVDSSELESVLDGRDLSSITKSVNFFLTDSADYRLAEFIRSCGIKTAGRGFNETVQETINAQVLVPITRKIDKNDPSKFYNEVGTIVGIQ